MPVDLNWDHNAWYHGRLLRALPERLDTALDVGCGAGAFAARLAARAGHVDAVDRDPHMVALARARVPGNVDVRLDDVTTTALPPAHYDAVTGISVLHHLDLEQVLPRLAAALRPGGLLIAIALPRTDLPRDLPVEMLSAVGHRLFGLAFRLDRLRTGTRRHAHETGVHTMPMLDPELTTRQVRDRAVRLLPGARVRRLPFWRYELRWRRPADPRS